MALFTECERRYKLLHLSPEAVLAVFWEWRRCPQYLSLPYFPDLPPGTEVIDCANDWQARSIVFRLWNPSWPVVPDGDVPPNLLGPYPAHESVRLERANPDEPTYIVPAGLEVNR